MQSIVLLLFMSTRIDGGQELVPIAVLSSHSQSVPSFIIIWLTGHEFACKQPLFCPLTRFQAVTQNFIPARFWIFFVRLIIN